MRTSLVGSVMLSRQAQRYQQIVDRFEELVRANIAKPTGIAGLCREAGVIPRTLSRAFRALRGTTPYCYLQQLRLSEVRRVLSSGSETATVTEVATRFGFRELGRFAAHYRQTFGESPSETKRRARSLSVAPRDGDPQRGRVRNTPNPP